MVCPLAEARLDVLVAVFSGPRYCRHALVEGGDEGPVGLAEAEVAKRAEQQVQAVADLGLGDPDRAGGAPVRQPVPQHRGHGVQADL
jgi:hypothetical protein